MPGNSIYGDDNRVSVHNIALNLDEEQLEACLCPYEDSLILAGAGSGKTRVIVYRIAYMMTDKIPEDNIMLLTFTNKASKEMLERTKKILEKDKINILGGTFHKIAVIFLRKYSKALGFSNNFTILDPDDAKSMIEKIRNNYIKEHGLKKKEFPEKKVIYDFYSKSINLNMDSTQLNIAEYSFSYEILQGVEEIVREYIQRKTISNALDFDDLLVKFRDLLEVDAVRKKITSQYKYILVDEYQDINWLQAEIIQLLNKANHHLFAVGDPNQAIYSWRGSEVKYIENFKHYYRLGNQYPITHNYRSDAEILKLAEDSINNNYIMSGNRVRITPFQPSRNKPRLSVYDNEEVQADGVAQQISNYYKAGMSYKEMAILIRANYLTKSFEKALRVFGIPYKVMSGKSFFERKHIKDILSFLRLIENPSDESAFYRICTMFDGMGEKTTEKVFEHYKNSGYLMSSLDAEKIKLNKRAKEGFECMVNILYELVSHRNNTGVMIEVIVAEFYDNYLKMTEEDYRDRMKDIDYLRESAGSYSDLSSFLSDMVLDEETVKTDEAQDDDDVVSITTLHKAKGLEWDCVFIPFLNDGIFPSARSSQVPEDIKEERRLMYVGITRARKHLNMSLIEYSSFTFQPYYPSILVRELDKNLYETM